MSEHTPKSESSEEGQRIPPTPRPVSSTPYVPPSGQNEANSGQSTHISDQNRDGYLAPPAGEFSGSLSANTGLKDTSGAMYSPSSDHAGSVNRRRIDTPGSPDEGVNQEVSHENGPHERKSTVSKSPTSPISAADDTSETDVTEYEVDEETSGMDVNSGLPPWDAV